MSAALITANWPAPLAIRAVSTTRTGGVSTGRYASMNLGLASGDRAADVAENRRRLGQMLQVPADWHWLRQVHGVRVVEASSLRDDDTPADAVVTRTPGVSCAVLSADCLPVLFTSSRAEVVAAAHAGWRGLSAGVLEATVRAMQVPADRLMAWLGPAISAEHYEVGKEVRDGFLRDDQSAARAFAACRPGHWLADLESLARARLRALGLTRIHGGGYCTFADSERFFSYRRDGVTGRMASLIWINPPG